MCGRYRRRSNKQQLVESFHIAMSGSLAMNFAPDDDIRPATVQPIIRTRGDTGERELVAARWGFIPRRQRPEDSFPESAFNARSETVEKSNLWHEALASQRCLVPADSFFEWHKVRKDDNPKYEIGLADGSSFAFAGLWNAWYHPGTTEWIQSFTILTTAANETLSPIHTRMPVIINRQSYERWLSVNTENHSPVDLLKPYDARVMRAQSAENTDTSPALKTSGQSLEINSL